MIRPTNRLRRDRPLSSGTGLLLAALSILPGSRGLAGSSRLPGGEFLLDTTVITGPAANIQKVPAIAFDGTNYLVVWQDYRDDGWHPHIYATRVGPEGQILDPGGIVVATLAASEQDPAVAFDGRDFLVAWVRGTWIAAARVAPDGQVLDTGGLIVSGAGQSPGNPAVASDGSGSLVVWSDERTASDRWIYAARVSQEGAILDTAGIPVGTTPGDNANPGVCFDGTSYLVVWDNQSYIPRVQDIRGIRLDTQAGLLDSTPFLIDTADGFQLKPSVAASDSGWMVVWQGGWEENWDISARRVGSDGRIIDSQDISVSHAPGNQVSPRITADSLSYMVTWEDWRGGTATVYAGRLALDGTLLDSTGIVISFDTTARSAPAVTSGSGCLVVWCDARHGTGETDIYGSRVTPDGGVIDTTGILVSTRVNNQGMPAVAFDDSNFLAVWTDDRRPDGLPSLYGVRVSTTGTMLDTAPFLISHAPSGQRNARVGFCGSYYLVAWLGDRTGAECIYATRVSRAGVVMDLGGIAVSSSATSYEIPADVASDGENFLVVWNEISTGVMDIRGARVSQAGTVLDPEGITICQEGHPQYKPCVAFNATNYLVAWADERDNRAYHAIVFACRVSPQGEVLDPNGIRVSRSSMPSWTRPTVASDGRNWLLAWADVDSGGIRGARVDPLGQVLDTNGFPVSRATPWTERDPIARWIAPNYMVAWEDQRGAAGSDIYLALVNRAGEVADSFALVTQPGDQSCVSIASDTGGHFLAVYTGWADIYAGQRYRANRVWGYCARATAVAADLSLPAVVGPELEVSPNPCRGILHIRARPGAGSAHQAICLHDAAGRLVRALVISHSLPGATYRLDLRDLPNGVYFVARTDCPGPRAKIVVQR